MPASSQNASHAGYYRVPPTAEGGADPAVIPARNVAVGDASPSGASDGVEPDAVFVSADRVKVEAPAGASKPSREVPAAQKVKGAVQMAGGAVLMAAGVPMCVLPGPGVASIAGGAALASKGQRNFSGRAATPLEERLDEAAQRLGAAAKEQAAKAARNAAEKAPEAAGKAVRAVAESAPKAARAAAKAAPAALSAASRVARAGAGAAARGLSSAACAGEGLFKHGRRTR